MKQLIGLGLVGVSALALADGQYMVVGGGYNKKSSALVLEKNVELFQSVSAQYSVSPSDIHIRFAAGHEDQDDVAYLDTSISDDESLFAELFADSNDPTLAYRHNKLQDLDGEATRNSLMSALENLNLAPGSFFRYYFTGHGSPSSLGLGYRENVMDLWNNTEVNVQEFTRKLDRLDPSVRVQTVMVQCFSGGFAQMNYEGGVYGAPIASHDRCGFFSTVPNQVAAGCSPDANQREEYSPYFFAAYAGKDEAGHPVNADYDGNGHITSDEAHVYVLLTEKAIDVPVKTSTQLLYERAPKFLSEKYKSDWKDIQKMTKGFGEKGRLDWIAIEGLAKQLNPALFDETYPIHGIVRDEMKAKNEKVSAYKEAAALGERLETVRKEFSAALKLNHKILADDYSKKLAQSPEYNAAREAFFGHALYRDYKKLQEQTEAAYRQANLAERAHAKWNRLIYAIRNVFTETEMPERAPQLVKKYQALKACEADSFFAN